MAKKIVCDVCNHTTSGRISRFKAKKFISSHGDSWWGRCDLCVICLDQIRQASGKKRKNKK
jgi:hypothetical protein